MNRISLLIGMSILVYASVVGLAQTPRQASASSPALESAASFDDRRDDDHPGRDGDRLDPELTAVLSAAGFTGRIERTYRERLRATLGRPIDPNLAELGRLLFFDNLHSLRQDNTCGSCHAPGNGFGDSQPIAIGVQNNNLVGPNRSGPRNQRRTPTVINTALYPSLMWNGRFSALSGDPFDNAPGFRFPSPEGYDRFSYLNNVANGVKHLLQAQAHMPPTELIEVAGFTGTCPDGIPDPTLGPDFCQFDDGQGLTVPLPDVSTGSRNEPIRQKGLAILNASPAYRQLFGAVFPEVKSGGPIDFFMFGKAIAEFEFQLVFANAPIDRFARGYTDAMTKSEKRGALVFFGKAGCVNCHAVAGPANEMFSDFHEYAIGVPQIAPAFGAGLGNFPFAGPNQDEDFGREEFTGDVADRYKFRTAPLRNLAASAAFFHNGAFAGLDDAIRFHLDVVKGARRYDPVKAGVPADLAQRIGPPVPVDRLDRPMQQPVKLTTREFKDLVAFVRDGLLDQRVNAEHLCKLVPSHVPSGMPVAVFEACQIATRVAAGAGSGLQ
jgi:cytochrome c peroxidase